MGSLTKALLKESHALSRVMTEERSPDLPAIRDGGRGLIIQPWRSVHVRRDMSLHRMMSRVGGFPPSLARYLIGAYSKPGDVVLDPFCGKGTTLLEACAAGRQAVGGDISPEAVISARAKCHPVTTAKVANYIQCLPSPLRKVPSDIPKVVSLFFHKDTLCQLLAIRKRLLADMEEGKDKHTANFLCGVILGLLHGHSALSLSLPCNQAFAMSPGYVRNYVREHNLKRPERDVSRCLLDKALELLPFPRPMSHVDVVESPAKQCHEYLKELGVKANLIITSPPYLNRQTYIKDAWLRLWFLNRDHHEIAKPSLETGNVARFVDGMTSAVQSMSRSIRKGGAVILVCGRANITVDAKPHSVRISDLCLLANSRVPAQWRLTPDRLIIDRKIMKRGSYFAVHHGKSKGQDGNHVHRFGEDEILILKKS